MVAASTRWPCASRYSHTSGAWLAGPPTSGGQIPEMTRTFISGGRDSGARSSELSAQAVDDGRPDCGEDAGRNYERACAAGGTERGAKREDRRHEHGDLRALRKQA